MALNPRARPREMEPGSWVVCKHLGRMDVDSYQGFRTQSRPFQRISCSVVQRDSRMPSCTCGSRHRYTLTTCLLPSSHSRLPDHTVVSLGDVCIVRQPLKRRYRQRQRRGRGGVTRMPEWSFQHAVVKACMIKAASSSPTSSFPVRVLLYSSGAIRTHSMHARCCRCCLD